MNDIKIYIEDLNSENKEERLQAVLQLSYFSLCVDHRKEIGKEGGIELLVKRLNTKGELNDIFVCQHAARVLGYLALDSDNRKAIRNAGGIVALKSLLSDEAAIKFPAVRMNAAWALAHLARNAKNQDAIRAADGIKALRELLSVDHKGIAEQAKGALEILQAQTTDQKEALNNAARASGGAGKAASNNSGATSALPAAQAAPKSAVRSDNAGETQSATARSRLQANNSRTVATLQQRPELQSDGVGNAQEHFRNAGR